jgi:hypothetical protein
MIKLGLQEPSESPDPPKPPIRPSFIRKVGTLVIRKVAKLGPWRAAALVSLLALCLTVFFQFGEFLPGGYHRNATPSPTPYHNFFPEWPLPAASARVVLPGGLFANRRTYGDLNRPISFALFKNGYAEMGYYELRARKGFIVVTRVEQIESDGTSKKPPARWSARRWPLEDEWTLSWYFLRLFTAPPGYYRVIAFVVTDLPFAESNKRIDRDEADRWLRGGWNTLPRWTSETPLSPDTTCTVLIYEFEVTPKETVPRLLVPGRLDAETHLVKSGLLAGLGLREPQE